MLKKIESLNKTIEGLMTEKTKADAQKGVWVSRLNEGIKNYHKEYGVDMSADSYEGIKEKLNTEIKKVEAETVKEYERAEKLVNLIQSGDIEGAWRELGVEVNKEVEKPSTTEAEVEHQSELQGVTEAITDVEEDLEDEDFFGTVSEDNNGGLNDGDFFVDEEEDTVEEEESTPVKPVFGGISFDDDDDDEFVIPQSKGGEVGISSDDEDGSSDNPFSSGSFGGFGAILEGSKFKPGN